MKVLIFEDEWYPYISLGPSHQEGALEIADALYDRYVFAQESFQDAHDELSVALRAARAAARRKLP